MRTLKVLVMAAALFVLAAVGSARDVRFIDGHAMIPMHTLKDSFGASVSYDSRSGYGITLDMRTVRVQPGYRQAWIGQRELLLASPVLLLHGIVYVPVSMMYDAFDYDCRWDNAVPQVIVVQPRTQRRIVLHYTFATAHVIHHRINQRVVQRTNHPRATQHVRPVYRDARPQGRIGTPAHNRMSQPQVQRTIRTQNGSDDKGNANTKGNAKTNAKAR